MIIQALIQVIDKENTNVVITLIESSQNEQLLKDGTVKGVDIENGYNTSNFIVETISGLKDVQKIEQANASRPDDSGYACVVVILNDESVYEIRVSSKNEN